MTRRIARTVHFLLAAAVSLAALATNAVPGDFDASFGLGGVWSPDAECCGPSRGSAGALQSDGKLLVAGHASDGEVLDAIVLRMNADGSLDGSFGQGGVRRVPASDFGSEGRAIQLLGDGSILVGGNYAVAPGVFQPFVAKLTSTGALDAAFADAGIARLGPLATGSPSATARAMAVGADGRIVIAGRLVLAGGDTDMFALRLNADGTRDAGFGASGLVASALPQADQAFDVAIAADGAVMLAGEVVLGTVGYPAAMKLLASGALDASFDADGIAAPLTGFPGTSRAVMLQADGKALFAGRLESVGAASFRVLATGALDATYNFSGVQSFAYTTAVDLAAMEDGDHAVVVQDFHLETAAVYKVRPDGTWSPTWVQGLGEGASGISDATGTAVVPASAGTAFLVSGAAPNGVVVFRRAADGQRDLTFGTFGLSVSRQGSKLPSFAYRTLAIDGSGRAYVVRGADCGGAVCAALERLTPDGRADPTFGTAGKVLLDSTISWGSNPGLAVLADGKLLIGEVRCTIRVCPLQAKRLNADGTVDTGFAGIAGTAGSDLEYTPYFLPYADGRFLFGTPGYLGRYLADGTTDPSWNLGTPRVTHAQQSAILPDGSVVEAGSSFVSRILPNGALDLAFGNNGTVGLAVGALLTRIYSVAAQADGRIVVGGMAVDGGFPSPQHYIVVRLLPSGALDASFGGTGIVRIPGILRTDGRGRIAIQADGKIVVGSMDYPSPSTYSGFVARLMPDGSLDTSFGVGGVRYVDPTAQNDTLKTLALLPDGAILLAGAAGERSAVMKLLAEDGALQINPEQLGVAGLLRPYEHRLGVTGGTPPYAFSLANGSLPPGVNLAADVIAGTPTATGRYDFTVRAVDATSAAAWRRYSIQVHSAPTLVTRYYEAILGRLPDAGGQAFWESEIARVAAMGVHPGEVLFAMAGVFFNSPEYLLRNREASLFIADLYTTFFGRNPDAAGLAFWTAELAAGKPKGAVLNDFLFSPEFAAYVGGVFGPSTSRAEVSMVVDFYRGLLGRLPDAAGFANWVSRFRAAQCAGRVTPEADLISAQFLASPEYANRDAARAAAERERGYVIDLYNAFLRRGGDLAGFNFWVSRIVSGAATREGVRAQFVASPEFQARVAAVQAQGCLAP